MTTIRCSLTVRILTTIRCSLTVLITGLIAPTLFAQVPAGVPFDPSKHPNAIVTWVNAKDFRKVSFVEASEQVGVELMSLSRDQADRESVEIAVASPARQKIRIIGQEYEVTFYPVMRQNYKLKSGNSFVLYTFRFPRALTTAESLNQAAFGPLTRGATPRFGSLAVPDRIEIRGVPGLYFDEGKQRTVYWFEMGAGYSVTTTAPKDELFRVLDDLL
jgi:hypothetical protein